MVPKVDTFAHDISDEIKHKEASLADIATASNDIGNTETTPMENKSSRIFAIAIVFLVIGIMGLIGFIYYYFFSLRTPVVPVQEPAVTETQPKKAANLSTLSVTLNENIGRNVESVVKNGNGYVLTLSSYSPVFAYMTRNEGDYIEELLDALNGNSLGEKGKVKGVATTTSTQSTSTPKAVATTTRITTASTTSATALVTSSTSVLTTTTTVPYQSMATWSDVTISNVNMRIYISGDRSVVYSFISTDKLVIAKTKEDVLSIKNAILR